jgi:hypothetical protein
MAKQNLQRPSVAELEYMASAPDLTRRERRRIKRDLRFAKRIEVWEARRSGPQPSGRWHRPIITVFMMVCLLGLLYLLLTGPPS